MGVYWPTKQDSPVEHGGLRLSLMHEGKEGHVITRDISIVSSSVSLSIGVFLFQDRYFQDSDTESHAVRQFQLVNAWPKGKLQPKDEDTLIALMDMVTRWQQQTGVAPVVIHCM